MKTLLLYILRRVFPASGDLSFAFATVSTRALDGANHDERVTLYQSLSSIATGLGLYEQAAMCAQIAAELRHADALQIEFFSRLNPPQTQGER